MDGRAAYFIWTMDIKGNLDSNEIPDEIDFSNQVPVVGWISSKICKDHPRAFFQTDSDWKTMERFFSSPSETSTRF